MGELIGSLFLLGGAIFLFSAGLGVLRMPDTYNRIQTGTKATTLGTILILIGLAFLHPAGRTEDRRLTDQGHVDVDVEDNLELARELNITRTPTVLVLDADGVIVRRASGQPRKADVIAALGEAIPA